MVQNSLLSNPMLVNAFLAWTMSIDIDSTLSPDSSANSCGIDVANCKLITNNVKDWPEMYWQLIKP